MSPIESQSRPGLLCDSPVRDQSFIVDRRSDCVTDRRVRGNDGSPQAGFIPLEGKGCNGGRTEEVKSN